jgi:hypothetical protein
MGKLRSAIRGDKQIMGRTCKAAEMRKFAIARGLLSTLQLFNS